jgi:hypothetical protein
MKSFDFYEFTGVLIPGVVVLYVSALIIPALSFISRDQTISIGSLALFVILSYVAGHLVQALGNLVERGFWKVLGGFPSDWSRTKKKFLLTDNQMAQLEDRVQEMLAHPTPRAILDFKKEEWFGITRQIYVAVQGTGKSHRVDTFNGNYGMFRGLAAAFLLCAVLSISNLPQGWKILTILFGCAALSLYRMHRFAVHYARELFLQFLQVDFTKKKEEK